VEYNDYRGVPVLAATQHIPLTGWGLVRKIDRAEALQDVRRMAIFEGLAAGLLIIFLVVLLLFHRREVLTRVLKQEEEKLRALLESAPDAIYIIEPSTLRILRRNRKAAEMDGYSDEEIAHMSATDLHPSEERHLLAESLGSISETGVALPICALHHRRKDGQVVPVEEMQTLVEAGNKRLVLTIVRDISERKRAEEALRESEARFRTLITDARVAMGVSRNGIALFVNTEFARLFGLENPEETIGRTILDFHAPQCHEWMKDIIRRGQQGLPTPTDFESIGRRKDGSTFPMHCAVSQINLADGPVTLGFLTDLSERKRAEEASRESEERYRTLIENSPVGIYRTTADGRILAGNPAFVQMMGYSSFEELASRNLNAPDFEPQYSRGQFAEKLEKEGRITGLESQWRRRDGSVIFVRENARAIQDEAGRILYYEGTAEDITERKRAEEALRESEQFNREVIASAQEGVAVYDREFRYQVWNRSMEELTGVPASEALGKQAFDLFPHLREQKLDLLIRRALAAEVVHAPDTPFHVPTTGKSGWVSNVYSPHFGANGQIHGVIGTIRDITERKRAEEALRVSHRFLEIANRHTEMSYLLKEFVAEVRNFTGCAAVGLRMLVWCPT
jgi:PAS domain S-box-containing protein